MAAFSDNKEITLDAYQLEDALPREAGDPMTSISKIPLPPALANMNSDQLKNLENKLRRKIDLRLLPMIFVMYIMNYLDRNNIAAARLAGLETELKLHGTQYQLAVSILFIGYLLMQIPSNMFLNKIGKPSLYLPSAMIIWGIISASTGAVKTYGGLLACRFCLGFVEAAYYPGCLYFISVWYKRDEIALRIALLYSGSLTSGAFGGLIAAGITKGMNGAAGLAAWRWLFILEGSLTVVIAALGFFILPDFPRTTKWLSEDERQMAAYRLELDIGEDDWVGSEQQSPFHGAALAAADYKVWLLAFTVFGVASSGTVTTMFPTVVKGLGYGDVETLLLTVPPYVIAVICILLNAWHADKVQNRWLHIALPPIIAIASFIICAATSKLAARYVAMCIMVGSVFSSYVVGLGWVSSCIPRPAAKRAAALGAVNVLCNVSQVYGPFLYPEQDGPKYVTAFCVNTATACLTIILAVTLRIILSRLNKELDRGALQHPSAPPVNNDGREHRRNSLEHKGLPGEAVDRGFRFVL